MKGGLGAQFLIAGLLLIVNANAQDDSLAGSFLSGKCVWLFIKYMYRYRCQNLWFGKERCYCS